MIRLYIKLLWFLWLSGTSIPVLANSWVITPEDSRISFTGTQTGNLFEGHFKTFDADIRFNPGAPDQAYVRAVIDMASAITGDTQRDEALPGKDWFFVSMFPQAVFEARGFIPLGGERFQASGMLSLKGVERPVTLPFTLHIKGDTAKMTSELSLLRSDFGVGGGPWAEGKWVGLEVSVSISLMATREN